MSSEVSIIYKSPFVVPYDRAMLIVVAISKTIGTLLLNIITFIAYYNGLLVFPIISSIFYILEKVVAIVEVKERKCERIFLDIFEAKTLVDAFTGSLETFQTEVMFHVPFIVRFYFMQFAFQYFLLDAKTISAIPQEWQDIVITTFIVTMTLAVYIAYVFNTFCSREGNILEFFPFLCVLMQHFTIFGSATLFIAQDFTHFWMVVVIKAATVLLFLPFLLDDKYELYQATTKQWKVSLFTILMWIQLISDTSPFSSCGKSVKQVNFKEQKLCSQRLIFLMRIASLLESICYLVFSYSNIPTYLSAIYSFTKVAFAINLLLICIAVYNFFEQMRTKKYEYFAELKSPLKRVREIVEASVQSFRFIEFMKIHENEPERQWLIQIPKDFMVFLMETISYIPIPTCGYRILRLEAIYSIDNKQITLSKDIFFETYCFLIKKTEQLPKRQIQFFEEHYQFTKEEIEQAIGCFRSRVLKFGSDENYHNWFPFESPETDTFMRSFILNMLQIQASLSAVCPYIPINPSYLLFDLYEDISESKRDH